jgi:AcrR family transcriptional regulator
MVVTTDIRPLRADARRNLERILDSARTLFAERGPGAQMEDIAVHAGVGIGTLYRRFPTKEALVTELVRERFQHFGVIAAECEPIEGPYDALATMMLRHAESVQDDVAFRLAMLNLNEFAWEGIEEDKGALNEIVARIIARAQAAGEVRADLRVDDYGLMMCGIVATMHYRSSEGDEWRRHLELVMAGLKES